MGAHLLQDFTKTAASQQLAACGANSLPDFHDGEFPDCSMRVWDAPEVVSNVLLQVQPDVEPRVLDQLPVRVTLET
jgi:hypothetical protein